MAVHIDTGKYGEVIAADYFLKHGYVILSRNWRCKHFEVDIIATRDNILYFIEVKTRRSMAHGFPEEKVSPKKIRHLIDASEEYLFLNPQWQRVQFNVLSINIRPDNEPPGLFLIEDVYL